MTQTGKRTVPTEVSIAVGPLVSPILRRVVGMLAARADLPLDRLDDAVLVADVIAAQAPSHVTADMVSVALHSGQRELLLRVGPLRAGGGESLLGEGKVPGIGNVIEQLADEVSVGADYLEVRLAYSGPS